jgi:hypothetical protein
VKRHSNNMHPCTGHCMAGQLASAARERSRSFVPVSQSLCS